MSTMDAVMKKLSTAAKTVTQKTGEFVELTKLNLNVSNEEDKLEKIYSEIGKMVYGSYSAGQEVSDEIQKLCESVDDEEAKIRIIKRKIAELKQTSFCKVCGVNVKKDALFCPNCGLRL